jgi:regulator of sigma E protease
MSALTTILAFLVTLGVLIVVHEWGHYKMARLCGVKVLRFSVGFGRTLWRRQKSAGDTEFVVAALPLGGYVKMLDEREEPVPAQEQHMAFNRKPLSQRAAIVAAGPIANLVLAVLLYATQNWLGIEEPKAVLSVPAAGGLAERAGLRSGDWVRTWSRESGSGSDERQEIRSMGDLRWQIMQAALDGDRLKLEVSDAGGQGRRAVTLELDRAVRRDVDATFLAKTVGLTAPYSPPVMGDPVAGGPAEKAGLLRGDVVLRVDGAPVADSQQLRERIRRLGNDGQAAPMTWSIERAGAAREIVVTPRVVADANNASIRVGRIDAVVGKMPEMVKVRFGALEGLVRGVSLTWEQSALTVKMFGRMLVGQASLKNLSGPITIADYAGQSAERGLAYYLGFLALVSVGLGVLNLLPVPLLDGGHLMYYLFEGVTGRPVSDFWLKWLQRGGALVLLLMMTLALSNDMARLLGLH